MKFFVILMLVMASFCGRAQAPYNFYHLFLEDGLSSARVSDIVQDKYGFMWFATPNGLNRYDGYIIKTFNQGKRGQGLPSSTIISLYTAKDGSLWIGTGKGAVTFDFASETFKPFDTSYKEGAAMQNLAINDFTEDKQGNIYAATLQGVYRYSASQKKWQDLNAGFQPAGVIRRVRRLKFFSDDLLFCSTSGNIPMFKIDLKKNTYDSLIDKNDTLPPNTYGLEKLNDQEMLGGLLSNGFSRFNVNTKFFRGGAGGLRRSDSVRYNTVYDILKDSRGRVWMASYYYRLAEYLPEIDSVVTFDSDPYNPFGFDGNAAICVYEDRQHNIWVGTGSKGVYRFNPDDNMMKFNAGLDRGSVFSLGNWDNHSLFIGSEKGPAFYNYNTGTTTSFTGIKNMGKNAPLEFVISGLPDKNGYHFWMGTERLGLMRYDRRTNEFKCFSRISTPKMRDDGVSNLLQLPNGNLFVIGWSKPFIFNTTNFESTTFRNDSSAVFALDGVSSICYDNKRNIWLSTLQGKLYEYDPLVNFLSDRTSLLASFAGLDAIYKVVYTDKFYLATNKGIVILHPGTRPAVFATGDQETGLMATTGILPDGEYVWFANNKRLGRLHPASGKILYVGEREGVYRMMLYPRSLMKSPQGNILIGSNKGYFEIKPANIKEHGMLEAPVLTAFNIYDQPLQTTTAVSGLKEINLKYSQNFFTFDMSSFNYNVAEAVQYAYKLEGFDKDWQYIGKSRKGSYTNVPGGNYKLRLKAGNLSGQWVENPQTINIHISTHFLKTYWFWLSLALLLAAVAWLLYRRRIARINKDAQLRSDYEIKLNELENSALRTQMNPHFIFNSLNTINSFISRNETTQAHQYISKFSKLIRYILDHSRQRKILLSDELEVLNLYIQIEQIRFENKFECEIIIDESIDTSTVELPPLVIQPFVENAILHGLLPMDSKGLLRIKIEHKDDLLLCTVEDNGIGREKAKELKKSFLVKHKSHGIEITLKRIELFNKEHGKELNVAITDIPEGGTRVAIPVAWEESF